MKFSSLKILGKKIKVVYEDSEEWGHCDVDNKIIYLSIRCLEDENMHFYTIVHEVTHMIFELSGIAYMDNNDEEAYVRCVENLIIPWVLEFKESFQDRIRNLH